MELRMDLPIAYSIVVALLAVAFLASVLRWAMADGRGRPAEERAKPVKPADYGLLTAIAVAPTRRAADVVAEQLREHGVRTTTVLDEDGRRFKILVFPADTGTAYRVLMDENPG